MHIQKKVSDAVMIVLPSDHAIGDHREYLKIISAAAKVADQEKGLVTIGIKPSSPETGFGYLEQGLSLAKMNGKEIFRVKSIQGKARFAQARKFVQCGNFYWNSGIFIWKASIILKEIERFLPDLYTGLMKIKEVLGIPKEAAIVPRVYKGLASISIDYGVMEKSDHVFVLPADFGWSDVGSWDALWEISARDNQGNALRGEGSAIFSDTEGTLVYSPKKLVALVGVKDLIIVETKDALLICKKGRSQDVKKVVDTLEATKNKKYL